MFKDSEITNEKHSNYSPSNEELYYEVERIVEKKIAANGKIFYLNIKIN